MEKATILVIEDNNVDRMDILNCIRDVGITNDVCFVTNAENALEEIKLFDHVIVLLDIHLPGMTGLDFLKLLRRTEGVSETTVFMLTSDPEHQFEAFMGLAAGYIDKARVKETIIDTFIKAGIMKFRLEV